MDTRDTINMLLDLAMDDNMPYAARPALLEAAEALVVDDADEAPTHTKTDDEAWRIYCNAYDGRDTGLAERREVMLPDALQPEGGTHWRGWTHDLLRRLARIERRRDDAMYAHLRMLAAPRPLSGA